jgi:L-iditol 2-dehydrogenase
MADEILRRAREGAMAALAAFGAPEGFDIVFECTGAESAIQMSVFVSSIQFFFTFFLIQIALRVFQAAMTGGRVMLIGMGTRAAYLPLSTAALREIDILGSFRYANTYPEAIALLSSKSPLPKLVAKLVTHRFKLEDTQKAFDMMERGVDDKGGLVLKVMIGSGESC